MSAHDADAAARVIERLLVDAAFRAEFRHDPALACREAGLVELAEQMPAGAGDVMQTLDVRESRSSLAGVMMAAALEGIGVFEFVEHIVPAAAAAPGAVHDVVSRVNLPAIDPLRGSLAAPPDPPPGAPPGEVRTDGEPIAARAAASAQAAVPAPAATASGASTATEPAAGAEPEKQAAEAGDANAGSSANDTANDGPPEAQSRQQLGVEPDRAPTAAAPPVDPAQFGAEGSGGTPNAEALALLDNKKVILDADGIADIKQGRIDPRVVGVLTKLSEKHTIKVSCMCRDHPELTTGGSVSNHHFGRGMDIAAIDGEPVNAGNLEARDIADKLGSLEPDLRPDEIGTPWLISDPGYFHDADHNDHIHVGFKQLIETDWKPPADVAAGGAGTAAAGGAGAGAGTPGGQQAHGTLALAVAAKAASPAGDTLSIKLPGDAPRAPSVARADAGAAELVKGVDGDAGAGSKAMAALKEALKYKGTAYLYGGSTPKTGFDCSGLVQWAYAQQGIQVPRVTDQQILASNGTEVHRGKLLPGDLVFFRNASGYVHHVGISMGGDKFLHAPHTGDVVKESSLSESYYAQEFAGGRRFDKMSSDPLAGADSGAAADPATVDAARAAHARDAAEAQKPGTLIFKALSKQEASNHNSTMQFMRAIRPDEATGFKRTGAADPIDLGAPSGPLDYPGDDAPKSEIAAWMGRKAVAAGLPRELPVMAALVESGLTNVQGGDRDSVGFFQMRLGTWNTGKYAGYPDDPELQLRWFIDNAVAVKKQRLARGETGFLADQSKWGLWIADVERPQEDLRYKYQLQLDPARGLFGGRS